jgi:uncharacterized phage protein (TIGR02218 family)
MGHQNLAHYLNEQTGRTFTYICDAQLGDGRGKLDLTAAGMHGGGAVASVVDQHTVTVTGLSGFASNFFANGLLTWTSGENEGVKMEVQRHAPDIDDANATLVLWHDMPFPIAPGDGFTVTAGCDTPPHARASLTTSRISAASRASRATT